MRACMSNMKLGARRTYSGTAGAVTIAQRGPFEAGRFHSWREISRFTGDYNQRQAIKQEGCVGEGVVAVEIGGRWRSCGSVVSGESLVCAGVVTQAQASLTQL